MSWTICKNKDVYDRAWALCRGVYQRGIVSGTENLSGSSLRGKAKQYGGKYQTSRCNLLTRLRAAGIPISECKGPNNRRILVIG